MSKMSKFEKEQEILNATNAGGSRMSISARGQEDTDEQITDRVSGDRVDYPARGERQKSECESDKESDSGINMPTNTNLSENMLSLLESELEI